MAVTLSQSYVETRLCSDSGTMTQVEVVTAPGDLLLILEAVGRVVAWQSAWQIDGGSPLAPLASYDEAGDGHLRVYAVTGLTPGPHTIDATNPASGGSTGSCITHGIVVASGADTTALDAGDVHADISGSTSATKTWTTGPVVAGGASLGLVASRRGAALSSVSPTSLGSSYVDGVTLSYAAGALHAITPGSDTAGETMTVVFGGTGGGAYLTLTLLPGGDTPSGPVANAGSDQVGVEPFTSVELDGTGSTGTITSWSWTQISGASVTLEGASTPTPTLQSPPTVGGDTLTFELTVSDGVSPNSDQVSVSVIPHTWWVIDSPMAPVRATVVG